MAQVTEPETGNAAFTQITAVVKVLFNEYFATDAAHIVTVTLLTGWILKLLPANLKSWAKQLMAFIVAITTALAAFFIGMGVYTELDLTRTLINAVLISFAANGFYDMPAVKYILEKLKGHTDRKSY